MNTLTAPEPRVHLATPARPDARRAHRLGQYATSDHVQTREIVSLRRPDGSTLVIDRLASTLVDARLVAQLAPEEPPENAQLLVAIYLADATRGRCRRLTAQDVDPANDVASPSRNGAIPSQHTVLRGAGGRFYRIRQLASNGSLSELRWTRSCHPGQADRFAPVSVRDVVGALEDYEPACGVTAHALGVHGERCDVSVCRLRGELERLTRSPIVLNRALRETVQRALARGELSMSEIAIRCGRMKRDRRGSLSGETSWLARRIGQLPEGGQERPTPWVHSDVLAVIARDGLHVAPHEVEL
jgi:hypothetical protein